MMLRTCPVSRRKRTGLDSHCSAKTPDLNASSGLRGRSCIVEIAWVLSVDLQENPVVVFPVLRQGPPDLVVDLDGLDALDGNGRLRGARYSRLYGAEGVDQVIDDAAIFEALLVLGLEQIQVVHHASPILYSCTVLGTHGSNLWSERLCP